MKHKRWAAWALVLALLNLGVLACIYSFSSLGEDRSSAQKIGRLISTYAEPESNPVFLVRAEDRCRFYSDSYCASARAQRRGITPGLYSNPIKLDVTPDSALFYSAYIDARARLIRATATYVVFLDTKPSDEDYLKASISFEEEAGVLVGTIVSNLYALQEEALRDTDHRANWAYVVGFLNNLLILIFVALVTRRAPAIKGS